MCFSNKFSEKPKSARAISRRRNTVDTRQLVFNLDDEDEDNNEGDNSKPLENDSASEVIELIVCFCNKKKFKYFLFVSIYSHSLV